MTSTKLGCQGANATASNSVLHAGGRFRKHTVVKAMRRVSARASRRTPIAGRLLEPKWLRRGVWAQAEYACPDSTRADNKLQYTGNGLGSTRNNVLDFRFGSRTEEVKFKTWHYNWSPGLDFRFGSRTEEVKFKTWH